ncbi:hypothetical protein SKB0092_17900 [Roseomonas mucosa]
MCLSASRSEYIYGPPDKPFLAAQDRHIPTRRPTGGSSATDDKGPAMPPSPRPSPQPDHAKGHPA